MFGVVCLLVLSFTVRADTFTDLYDDPYGAGKDIENKERTMIKHEFTASTEKMEYSDGTGNIIISSGQIYADSIGTRLENAKSLKDCEFCEGFKMSINLDKKFNVTVEDYNYTDFKNVCFKSEDIGQIPLKINLLTNKSEKQLDIKVATTLQTVNKWRCYNFTVPKSIMDYEIEWGWNSTFVKLSIGNITNDVTIYDGNLDYASQIQYNISSLSIISGIIIDSVMFYGYIAQLTSTIDADATISRQKSKTWTEVGCNVGSALDNITTTFTWSSITESTWTKINVTQQVSADVLDKNNLTSFRIEDSDFLLTDYTCYNDFLDFGSINGFFLLEDRENHKATSKFHYLNISYVSDDTTKPSFSTIPYNSTTTNQSATITWTPSESANYTLRYTTTADYTGGTLISNATSSASQRDVGIYPLVNYTSYYINVSIWDTSGNYNQSNFSFRTNQNVANSCATCNILCSDNCVLTTNINCAAGAATVSGAGTLSGQRYLTNWQTLTINGGCVVQY